MISGGNATVMVSSMDAAIRFYTEILELKLTSRFGDDWATVDAGRGLIIGLHPASAKFPAPGTKGGIVIGLEINESIEEVVKRLQAKGVRFRGPIVNDEVGSFADFEDLDGNPFYLWEANREVLADSSMHSSHA